MSHGECPTCKEVFYSQIQMDEHVCYGAKEPEKKEPEMKCENCIYWDKEGFKAKVIENNPLLELDDNQGICHRYPQYEIRDKEYWCGEFKPKEKENQ